MEALLSPAALSREIEALGAGKYLADPLDLLAEALEFFRLPERVSTVECAEQYRKLPGPEDGAVVSYDRWQTPYNVGPMNALDDPECNLIVMVKPSRSGGTAVVENFEFKMQLFGPMGHIAHILNSDEAVTDYCRNVVSTMYDLNPKLAAKIDPGRGNNTDSFKRVRGYPVEYLSAKDSTFRNREPIFMVSDETDAWGKKYAATPKTQIDGRQKRLGNRRKGAILSHPDLGWKAGVAAAYEDTSRGIYVMQCPHCLGHAAAYATKFWPGVPQFKLDWQKDPEAANDERLDMAEHTASLVCPHCGSALTDEERRAMVDAALTGGGNAVDGWMHRGQTLDPDAGVIGYPDPNTDRGFWIHGTMLKTEHIGKLARAWQLALINYERTRDVSVLKEFMSKQLGEVFEGAATLGGLSTEAILKRAKPDEDDGTFGYDRGTVPDGVRFITAAADTGGRKFDVAFIGWDLEGRSWLIDRITIRQRRHADGQMRDLHLARNVDDWWVLADEVVERTFPLASDPDKALPVACVCIDSGDGNVTWKAREFARRSLVAGHVWGKQKWAKVRLIKGFEGKRPALPDAPRPVTKDDEGRPVEPIIREYNLGADALKDMTYERLAIEDGSPGECFFYRDFEKRYADEFFGEQKIDDKWVRSGPNETLDVYGYAEAARQILKPDRADIKWASGKLPPWATPISLKPKGGDQSDDGRDAPAAPTKTRTHRGSAWDRLNRN